MTPTAYDREEFRRRDMRILSRYLAGETQRSLAREYGVSNSRVKQICDEEANRRLAAGLLQGPRYYAKGWLNSEHLDEIAKESKS